MNNREQNLYDSLEPRHQLAIDLRLAGATYKQMAKNVTISTKEHTIRTWFMEGGICKEAYEWKKRERAEERDEFFQQIHEQINDIAISAIYTLRKAVEEGNVQASLKILELADTKRLLQVTHIDEVEAEVEKLRSIIQAQRDYYRKQYESEDKIT